MLRGDLTSTNLGLCHILPLTLQLVYMRHISLCYYTPMVKIPLKPISVNEAYRGRRFSTPALKTYKQSVQMLLPKCTIPLGKLAISYRFGLSSKGSDYDNLIKATQDAISEGYGFNDNRIYKATIEKVDVKKGEEFIEFEIAKA